MKILCAAVQQHRKREIYLANVGCAVRHARSCEVFVNPPHFLLVCPPCFERTRQRRLNCLAILCYRTVDYHNNNTMFCQFFIIYLTYRRKKTLPLSIYIIYRNSCAQHIYACTGKNEMLYLQYTTYSRTTGRSQHYTTSTTVV